jgi:hypothetical protein
MRRRWECGCPVISRSPPGWGCAGQAEFATGRLAKCRLPGRSGDVGGDDVSGVPVQGGSCPVVSHGGPRVGVGCGFLHITQRDPASRAAVMNACRSVWGPTGLAIPARRATLRTILPAPCRSSLRPSAARKIGPSYRLPTARSIARAVRGASGMVTTLPPLRVMTRVRWPRSTPRASMLAPVASETRGPLSASSESSACSAGGPSRAATSSAPSSIRSSPMACDS